MSVDGNLPHWNLSFKNAFKGIHYMCFLKFLTTVAEIILQQRKFWLTFFFLNLPTSCVIVPLF